MPHRDDAMIENVVAFKTHAVAQVREGGSVKLRLLRGHAGHTGNNARDVVFDELAYNAVLTPPSEFDADRVRFTYNSLTTPTSTYEAELATGKLHLLKVQSVQGGYDASRYASERLWFKAADGTQVPVSLVYRRPAQERPAAAAALRLRQLRHPDRPALHQPAPVAAGPGRHLRHCPHPRRRRPGPALVPGRQAGQEDEHLHRLHHLRRGPGGAQPPSPRSSSSRAAVRVGSDGRRHQPAARSLQGRGGPGAVCRRDQHHARRHLPLTTEDIRWGNPNKAAEYAWMRTYSPYDNLKPAAYPAVLARTAINDSQVPYWEAAKWVAKIRTLNSSSGPVLYDINMTAGHGGASAASMRCARWRAPGAFMLQQWGLLP